MTIKDPVLADEARHDRQQEAQTMRYEKALAMAKDAYRMGEYDDEIQDNCDPADVTKIAIAVLRYLDSGSRRDPTPWLFGLSLQVRDLRATVDGVLERHAPEIMENDG